MSRRRKIAPPIDDDRNRWSTERLLRHQATGKSIPRKEKLEVRHSPIHGRGVFARVPLQAGEVVIEYLGAIIDWPEAMRRHPHDPEQPNHTFYFTLDYELVIDGNDAGNRARWINHSCEPNCESEIRGQRVFILALRDIEAGEELNFDYGLVLDEELSEEVQRDYLCLCGAPTCRGTMLDLNPDAGEGDDGGDEAA